MEQNTTAPAVQLSTLMWGQKELMKFILTGQHFLENNNAQFIEKKYWRCNFESIQQVDRPETVQQYWTTVQ